MSVFTNMTAKGAVLTTFAALCLVAIPSVLQCAVRDDQLRPGQLCHSAIGSHQRERRIHGCAGGRRSERGRRRLERRYGHRDRRDRQPRKHAMLLRSDRLYGLASRRSRSTMRRTSRRLPRALTR